MAFAALLRTGAAGTTSSSSSRSGSSIFSGLHCAPEAAQGCAADATASDENESRPFVMAGTRAYGVFENDTVSINVVNRMISGRRPFTGTGSPLRAALDRRHGGRVAGSHRAWRKHVHVRAWPLALTTGTHMDGMQSAKGLHGPSLSRSATCPNTRIRRRQAGHSGRRWQNPDVCLKLERK